MIGLCIYGSKLPHTKKFGPAGAFKVQLVSTWNSELYLLGTRVGANFKKQFPLIYSILEVKNLGTTHFNKANVVAEYMQWHTHREACFYMTLVTWYSRNNDTYNLHELDSIIVIIRQTSHPIE
jgi:hypothetical protein